MDENVCPECEGTRLRKESLYFKLNGKNIGELVQMDVAELSEWFADLPNHLSEKQQTISTEILKEITARLQFFRCWFELFILNRSSKSLSGGEAQRIRLATQIGSQLVGVLYILMNQVSVCTKETMND